MCAFKDRMGTRIRGRNSESALHRRRSKRKHTAEQREYRERTITLNRPKWIPGTVFQQRDKGWTCTEDSSGLAGSPGSHTARRRKKKNLNRLGTVLFQSS